MWLRKTSRFLSLIMALIIALSQLPLSSFANETTATEETEYTTEQQVTEDQSTIDSTDESTYVTDPTVSEPDEIDLLTQVCVQMESILEEYGIQDGMSEEDIQQTVFALDADQLLQAQTDIAQIAEQGEQLSEDDLQAVSEHHNADEYEVFCCTVDQIYAVTPLTDVPIELENGNIEITDTNNKGSYSGGKYTTSISSSSSSVKTNTIYIYNRSDAEAKIGFTYIVSGKGYNDLTIADTSKTLVIDTEYTHTVDLAKDASIKIELKAKGAFLSNRQANLTLKNFTYEAFQEKSDVTFDYDSTMGKVTVAGSEAKDEAVVEFLKADGGKELKATASGSAVFIGWRKPDGALISRDNPYTLTPTSNMTVQAVFATTSPWFLVDNIYLINGLKEATDTGSNLVLMNTATLLPDTDYTIPATDSLLIPHSATDTGAFTGEPDIQVSTNPGSSPANAFRTLTLPSSSTITCKGKINVNGQRSNNGQPFCGTAVSGYGKLILGAESKTFSNPKEENLKEQLNIADGGKLYCYGYITGSGMVAIEKNGTAHELLQMADWPGGSNGTSWKASQNNQFLLSQYFVQNIEAPLKIYYGGVVNFEAVITASSQEQKFSSTFIGTSSGLFRNTDTSAYILRIYDQSQDRMNYYLKNGAFTFGEIEIYKKIGLTGLMDIDISSADAILPLTNNLTVYIDDGATFNMSYRSAILPGAEIVIEKGSTVNLTNNLYIYDVADWSGVNGSAMSMFFNRVAQAVNDGWLPSGANQNPKSNPLPYVATLDGVSPRATQFYAESKGSGYCQTDPLPITASGKLVVNGTLKISGSGALLTTTGGSTANKAITGTGTIDYSEGTIPSTGTITVGTDSYATTVNVGPAVAYLAGFDGLQNFGKHVYHGQSNGYWYNHKVSAVDPAGKSAASSITVQGTAAGTDANDSKVVGYFSYDASGQSTFDFTVTTASVTTDVGTVTAKTANSYSLTNVTSDATLTLPLIHIYGTSIRAGDSLNISFYVANSDFDSSKTYTARIVRTRQGIEDDVKEVAGTVTSDGYLRFVYDDIAAKEMTDEVYITVYEGNYQVSQTASESVLGYALRSLSRTDDTKAELRTALIDMLNYGASAQKFFKINGTVYNANDLATTGAENYQKYATKSIREYSKDDVTNNVNLYAASISAESKLVLTFYFQNISKEMNAVATYTDHYGTLHKVNVSGDKFRTNGDLLGVDVEGLAIADGTSATQVTCVVTDATGAQKATATASVEGYVAATIAEATNKGTTVDDVYYNLMKFIDSAYAYFH